MNDVQCIKNCRSFSTQHIWKIIISTLGQKNNHPQHAAEGFVWGNLMNYREATSRWCSCTSGNIDVNMFNIKTIQRGNYQLLLTLSQFQHTGKFSYLEQAR